MASQATSTAVPLTPLGETIDRIDDVRIVEKRRPVEADRRVALEQLAGRGCQRNAPERTIAFDELPLAPQMDADRGHEGEARRLEWSSRQREGGVVVVDARMAEEAAALDLGDTIEARH